MTVEGRAGTRGSRRVTNEEGRRGQRDREGRTGTRRDRPARRVAAGPRHAQMAPAGLCWHAYHGGGGWSPVLPRWRSTATWSICRCRPATEDGAPAAASSRPRSARPPGGPMAARPPARASSWRLGGVPSAEVAPDDRWCGRSRLPSRTRRLRSGWAGWTTGATGPPYHARVGSLPLTWGRATSRSPTRAESSPGLGARRLRPGHRARPRCASAGSLRACSTGARRLRPRGGSRRARAGAGDGVAARGVGQHAGQAGLQARPPQQLGERLGRVPLAARRMRERTPAATPRRCRRAVP